MGKSGKIAYFVAVLGIIMVLLSLGGVITLGGEKHAGSVHRFLSSGPAVGEERAVPGGTAGKYRIVIDPGHGGKDPGATSVSGREEKDFTLALAEKVYKRLEQDSMFEPVLTRTSDEFIELEDRSKVANELHANAFISLHGNTYEGSEPVSGTETYYYNRGDGSYELAEMIHQHLIEALGFRDRGVRQEGWKVLRTSEVPAVLAEIGFLTNAENESDLFSEAGQDKAAQAIVDALKRYFGK